MTEVGYHKSVLFDEVMEGLKLFDGGVWFDGTLGGGGHTRGILERTSPNGLVIAVDRDMDALRHNEGLKNEYSSRLRLIHARHENLQDILFNENITHINGAIFDLGLSSYQIDNLERGFSYSKDARLDMRMDTSEAITAEDIINDYSEKELANIIYRYGEERFSYKIAAAIVKKRAIDRIKTTKQLADLIEACIPKAVQSKRGHPAKKTFQAIRIALNGELAGLEKTLYETVERLVKGGRLAVISFHSLEDIIAKRVFKDLSSGCNCSKKAPVCVCGRVEVVRAITKKPLTASEKELAINPRAASAKLRIVEKL